MMLYVFLPGVRVCLLFATAIDFRGKNFPGVLVFVSSVFLGGGLQGGF